jgi:hypothetical protein
MRFAYWNALTATARFLPCARWLVCSGVCHCNNDSLPQFETYRAIFRQNLKFGLLNVRTYSLGDRLVCKSFRIEISGWGLQIAPIARGHVIAKTRNLSWALAELPAGHLNQNRMEFRDVFSMVARRGKSSFLPYIIQTCYMATIQLEDGGPGGQRGSLLACRRFHTKYWSSARWRVHRLGRSPPEVS